MVKFKIIGGPFIMIIQKEPVHGVEMTQGKSNIVSAQ